MLYDPKALDLEWNDALQSYDVWYDGEFLGNAESDEAAHYMIVDHVVLEADLRCEEER